MTRPRTWHRDSGWMVGAILVVTALTAAFWNYTQDDVFITFTYSRNLAEGHGFVFNPGERVQGTTTPLYALLIAGIYRLSPDLLHAGNLLGALCLIGTCALALAVLRPYVPPGARGAAALSIAASPLVYVSLGMETLLYSLLLVLGLTLWARGRPRLAMLSAAALTWTRADGVVFAAACGMTALIAVWRSQRWRAGLRQALILAAIYLAGILPWFAFAWAYFGTPLPQTFSAKEAFLQGTLFWQDALTWARAFYGHNPLMLLGLPLAGIGLWRAIRTPPLQPLAFWPLLYTAGYTALNVTAFWYYTPLLIVLILLAALGGGWLAPRLRRRALTNGLLALAALAIAIAAAEAWRYRHPPPRMATYRLLGEWIAAHTPPASTLMVKDLGIAGYYAQRPTKDTFGLIVPDLGVIDDRYAVLKYKLDYVLTTQYWEMQRLVAQEWFGTYYVPVVQISTAADAEFSPMALYRRRLPLTTPTEGYAGLDLPLTCTVQVRRGQPLPAEVLAVLLTSDRAEVVSAAHPFLWDQRPGTHAPRDETFVEQIALPLEVPPGNYRWELICDRLSAGTVTVLPLQDHPRYHTLEAPPWGGVAALRGLVLPETLSTWSGGALELILEWEALGPAQSDYSVFVHLVAADGTVRAQADGFPRGRPVTTWTPGEHIVDRREINLPPDLPAGEYQLVVGWYDWRQESLPRVPLADGSDALVLPVRIDNRWPGGSGLPAPE